MKVNLQLSGTIARLAAPSLELELKKGATVSDLIEKLVRRYGAEFGERINHREMWQIGINGHLQLLATAQDNPLRDHDQVLIIPLQFGG